MDLSDFSDNAIVVSNKITEKTSTEATRGNTLQRSNGNLDIRQPQNTINCSLSRASLPAVCESLGNQVTRKSTGFQLIEPAFPLSSASSLAMSSASRAKSYSCVLEWMRAGVADLGRGM